MQELVETIEGIVGSLKLNLLVMKSLDMMKSNSELWVLREKIIYTYPRCTCMIVNRDSHIEI